MRAGDELVELDRFRQVVVGSMLEPVDAIGQIGVAGDEDDRQVRRRGLGAQPLDHLETAEPGHLAIENHEVDRVVLEDFERPLAVRRDSMRWPRSLG